MPRAPPVPKAAEMPLSTGDTLPPMPFGSSASVASWVYVPTVAADEGQLGQPCQSVNTLASFSLVEEPGQRGQPQQQPPDQPQQQPQQPPWLDPPPQPELGQHGQNSAHAATPLSSAEPHSFSMVSADTLGSFVAVTDGGASSLGTFDSGNSSILWRGVVHRQPEAAPQALGVMMLGQRGPHTVDLGQRGKGQTVDLVWRPHTVDLGELAWRDGTDQLGQPLVATTDLADSRSQEAFGQPGQSSEAAVTTAEFDQRGQPGLQLVRYRDIRTATTDDLSAASYEIDWQAHFQLEPPESDDPSIIASTVSVAIGETSGGAIDVPRASAAAAAAIDVDELASVDSSSTVTVPVRVQPRGQRGQSRIEESATIYEEEEGDDEGEVTAVNPKGRSKGQLGKPTGDLFFGFGANRPHGQHGQLGQQSRPVYTPSREYGVQGMRDVRQGVGEPIWHDFFADGVAGFKLLVGDLMPEWEISMVLIASVASVDQTNGQRGQRG